jgi:hypothetical protein
MGFRRGRVPRDPDREVIAELGEAVMRWLLRLLFGIDGSPRPGVAGREPYVDGSDFDRSTACGPYRLFRSASDVDPLS